MGFIDKAKALIGKQDGDNNVGDAVDVDGAVERAQTSDELLDKAKAAIDKLLE